MKSYEFTHLGKTFQLLDLPGIEGDEVRYEAIIQKGIAKSHLVFYVNGANKKPEAATAEKIKRYLRREASVLPVCNIRGKADLYEFPEDRTSLQATHKDADEILHQTIEVLSAIIGPEVLLDAKLVQGLMAFSALAINENNRSTCDLTKQYLEKDQKGFLEIFPQKELLRDFSRIDLLSEVVSHKLSTFERDILLSNRRKVSRLLTENVNVLQMDLENYRSKCAAARKAVNECEKRLKDRFSKFKIALNQETGSIIEQHHNRLRELSDTIVDRTGEDEESIQRKLRLALNREIKSLESEQAEITSRLVNKFVEERDALILKLQAEIERVEAICNTQSLDIAGQNHVGIAGLTVSDKWGSFTKTMLASAGLGATIASGGTFPIIVAAGHLLKYLYEAIFVSTDENLKILKKQAREAIAKNILAIRKQNGVNVEKIEEEVSDKVLCHTISSLQAGLDGMKNAETVLERVIVTLSSHITEIDAQPL
ncbi:MAG: hypothetical protein A2089_03735 [Elusimicrobia bacterium GWD2_63_28]|nr:MAG: hypothetical protein A2089_03735 [Elusimicrobia bacterium GWD2_63_28]